MSVSLHLLPPLPRVLIRPPPQTPTRCSIIAAANPVGGHYHLGKTVSENLKMSGALFSRFDLVFIMLDRPDDQHDARLSRHIVNMHRRDPPAEDQVSPSRREVVVLLQVVAVPTSNTARECT